ncbi:MAG: hypothetical protein E7462_04480 [Ruminococcaceae bacterium]|nr:hypothetical protein [Oscillospiraceae bacterium]
MGGYPLFMLTPLLSLLIGLLLGFLAGLGIGGGSLLILWLTLVVNMDAETARSVNLLFFLAAAGGVCVLRLKKGKLNLKKILPAILGGCVAAGLCSWLGMHMEQTFLRKIFGILLLFTGLRELFYRPRKDK